MEIIIFIAGCVISWVISIKTGFLLFRHNKENLNPLDWGVIDRCLLLITIYFILGGFTGFTVCIRKLFKVGHVPWINFRFWDTFLPIIIVFGLILLILWMIGLRLRQRALERPMFVHTVVQFSAIIMALVCYVFGPLTDPKGFLIGIAQGALNFILFGITFTLPWIATYIVILVGLMIAVWAGMISYGPFYISTQFVSEKFEGVYWISMLAQELMMFLLLLLLIGYIVARWKDRENKLADTTALLKKMFGRYLSTEVMKSLIEDPLKLELGGERRNVTIMMTDLRGFTAISERLDPEQVVQMLNYYFEIMVEIVLQYNGTINEIIGDALLVIFGAPQEMPDRAQQAIACAIEMQNAMAKVNGENRPKGLPELEMGIGINEAEVIVGNIGSSKRSKYTVVGSGVNMASRIESYTVGGQVLISESVRKKTGDVLRIDSQRDVLPKGAETPIRIYEVGGIAGRYNLALEGKDAALITITRQIPLQYMVLEGKDVGKKGLKGSVMKLSRKCAQITLSETIKVLTNIKMNLEDVDEELGSKHFYGKVIKRSEESEHIHMVRFTAVPPEVNAYFQALRKHVAKSEGI